MNKNMNSLSRRQALLAGSALLLPTMGRAEDLEEPLAALERRAGGRLGVAVLDTASGATIGHRSGERFGMCSTFKLPLAGLVLQAVDQGRLRLDQWQPYGPADMVRNSPITEQHLARGGMTVGALTEATLTTSDNVAANLLIALIGGPAGMTAGLRSLGDAETRVDRLEPSMNLVPVGELRDTTTPLAMARTTARLLRSDALTPASMELLGNWMVATETGRKRLRAGFPPSWRAGDRTGTAMAAGMVDKYNDVAIAWPNPRTALIVAAYYDGPGRHDRMRDEEQAVLAEVGRIAAAWHASGS